MSGYNAFPDIVKDCPKMGNLPKIFLWSFENVDPDCKPFLLHQKSLKQQSLALYHHCSDNIIKSYKLYCVKDTLAYWIKRSACKT